jgi:hypothetical protein
MSPFPSHSIRSCKSSKNTGTNSFLINYYSKLCDRLLLVLQNTQNPRTSTFPTFVSVLHPLPGLRKWELQKVIACFIESSSSFKKTIYRGSERQQSFLLMTQMLLLMGVCSFIECGRISICSDVLVRFFFKCKKKISRKSLGRCGRTNNVTSMHCRPVLRFMYYQF